MTLSVILMKRGAKSARVIELQHALLSLGYPLPRWGDDGDLGEETLDALKTCLTEHDKTVADPNWKSVSQAEFDYVVKLSQTHRDRELDTPIDHDHRDHAGQRAFERWRKWTEVTGFCLHQTACNFSSTPERWRNVGCHVGVMGNADAIWLHEFTKQLAAANLWNNGTISCEINGLFHGVRNDPKTLWNDPETSYVDKANVLTEAMVLKSHEVIRWWYKMTRDHGGNPRVIIAHRQASPTRRNDPGEEIWERIAVPMLKELKLSDGGYGFKLGEGYPIPEEWDETKKGIKY